MIERHFLGWARPILPSAARHLAETRASGSALDLRDLVVVVPGSRAGRRLKELLLEESEERKLRFTPPRVVTSGALPELFYRGERPMAPPLVVRRAWAEALASAAGEPLAAAVGTLPGPGDHRGWDLLGGQVAELHRECAGGGHTFADVAAICAGGELGFDDSARWSTLARVQGSYARRLGELGYADLDLARIEAAASGRLAAETDVAIVGIAELPAIARRIVRGAGSRVLALVQAPESEAAGFDDLGLVRAEAWRSRRIPLGPEQVRVADRPAGQAAEVLRELGSAGGVGVGEVAVGAADESVVPYLEEWLGAAGIPTHHAAGRPMRHTAPYRLLEAVAGYLEGRRWEEFAALIRHPDVESTLRRGAAEGAGLGWVDRYFTRHLPAEVGGELPGGGHRAVHAILRRLEGKALLRRLSGTQPLNRWAERITAFLAEVYGSLDVGSPAPADQQTVAALRELRSAALALHRLPPALAARTRADFAIHLLLQLVDRHRVAEEGDREAVELLGWLELATDDAPVTLVTGVNEGTLPQSRSAHAFLPDRLRTRLGLLDNAGRYARDAFLLTGLVHSRSLLRVVSGRMTAEGDPLRPSRLLLTADGEELARAVLAFTSGPTSSVRPPLLAAAGEVSAFGLPPEPILRVEPPTELTVTAFAEILRDPYRWVLERRLGLEAVDDGARELDGAGFGTLAHRVLGRFGRSDAARVTDPNAIAAALDTLLDEEANTLFGARPFPAVQVQIEQLRARLRGFAAWQAGWVAEGWEIILVEGVPLSADPFFHAPATACLDVDDEPVVLLGRIDRVDRNARTGQLAILDYKTSDAPKSPEDVHRKRGEWRDLQLPLYRRILAATVDAAGESIADPDADVLLGYLLLSRDDSRVGAEFGDWGVEDLLEAEDAARKAVRFLRRGVVEFDRGASATWQGDPLAPLLGHRLLLAAEAEESGDLEVV